MCLYIYMNNADGNRVRGRVEDSCCRFFLNEDSEQSFFLPLLETYPVCPPYSVMAGRSGCATRLETVA